MGKKRKNKSESEKTTVSSVDEMLEDCAADSDTGDGGEAQQPQIEEVEEEQPVTKKGRKEAAKKHAASLDSLKDKDPEFYEFLQNEDKEGLLSFNPDELDGSSSDGSDSENEHVPGKLEVATDSEDDSESEDDVGMDTSDQHQATAITKTGKKKQRINVTVAMIKKWSQALREHNSVHAFQQCVSAFKAAVLETSGDKEQAELKYKVEGSIVFNSVVRLCIIDMAPMLNKVLKVPPKAKDAKKPALPVSSNKWPKVKVEVKSYLTDMLQFVSQLSEPAILNVVLKHIHQLVLYYVCFPKLTKTILKKLINIWSSGEETSRVLAFLSIIKITRITQDSFLEYVIKQMYMAFVQNCKFTSPTTLPLINFMQRSLVEVLALDLSLTYQYAFIYIRQMAIHLRNAIMVQKKETVQAVYNWQFVHSLNLWCTLLSQLYPNETLEPLIYPLTQVTIGTIKLVPSARYYPLRFHCVRMLNMLSDKTHTFIPTLPFITELFQQTDFNKNHKSIGFKPFNFACILKLTPTQLQEKAFRDGIIDQTYDLLLESFTIHAHSVSFPELALPAVIQIKDFLKKCKVVNFTKIMKQMLEKVQANSDLITKKRRSAGLTLKDSQRVDAWERALRADGTPLSKLYAQYKKKRVVELQLEIAGTDRISSEDLPKIERRPVLGRASEAERKEFKGLFESDSDDEQSSDDDDDDNRFLLKEERPEKKRKIEAEDDSDEYSDFDEEEMEALDRSASESEGDGNDGSEEEDSGENESDSGENESDSEENERDSRENKSKDVDISDDVSDTGDIVEDFKFSDSDDDSS